MAFLVWFFVMLLPAAAHVQEPLAASEEFLLQARIVGERRNPGQLYAWRVSLDDGMRTHDASVDTEDGTTPTQRDYRFNVAAYELDKALDLHLVPPSVVRTVDGRPASVTWWVDEVAMAERDRRQQKIQPLVKPFDELIARTSESAVLYDLPRRR
jgi:hypothetical protein